MVQGGHFVIAASPQRRPLLDCNVNPGAGYKDGRQPGVLIVDDQVWVRDVLALGLRNQGFSVWTAPGGKEGAAVYREYAREIDVVLVDVRMPDMDGPQTLEALRRINSDVRCCFMSGDLGDYSGQNLLDFGALAVLEKPFDLKVVAAVLVGLVMQNAPTSA
jgi:CheY-like chemotaxis protein